MSTKTRFEKEAKGNSEMAYLQRQSLFEEKFEDWNVIYSFIFWLIRALISLCIARILKVTEGHSVTLGGL